MNVFQAPAEYRPDESRGRDLLGVDSEAEMLASLIAARMTAPPLSLGLFGAADSAVSFFMRRVRDRVQLLATAARDSVDGAYVRNILQVEFNAWHYAGGNAWIALVEVVFNALDRWIETSSGQGAAADRVFNQLGTAKRLRRELETQVMRAQVVAERAQDELVLATKEYEDAVEAAGTAAARPRWDEVTAELTRRLAEKPEVAAEIDADGVYLGFEGLSGTPEEMGKILDNAKTVSGRAGLLTSSLVARRHASNAFLIGIGMLILVGSALVLGRLFVIIPTAATAVESAGTAITILSTAIAIVGLWLGFVVRNQTLSAIVRLRKREPLLREVVRAVDRDIAHDVAVAQERVVAARKRVDDARAQVAPARAEAARAEQALADYDSDRVLRRVTEFYRDQLRRSGDGVSASVIPIIREDFLGLSELMHVVARRNFDASSDETLFVERIVVYITDLDRCPPDVAVDVLQVTQLLLAFPLFVVVVATDPRWLLRAVAPRYRRMLGRGGAETDVESAELTGPDEENESISYLARVFHIPFWVRRMDRATAHRVVQALLPSRSQLPVAEPVKPAVTNEALESAPRLAEVSTNDLTDAEIRAIERVASLVVRSLRDANRLVISYRILRASLSPAELSAFVGAAGERGAYRAVTTQLAIAGAAPQLTSRYFRVLKSGSAHTVSDLLGQLAHDVAIVSHSEWPTLHAVLEDYRRESDNADALRDLVAWHGAAARHSFAVPSADPAEDTLPR